MGWLLTKLDRQQPLALYFHQTASDRQSKQDSYSWLLFSCRTMKSVQISVPSVKLLVLSNWFLSSVIFWDSYTSRYTYFLYPWHCTYWYTFVWRVVWICRYTDPSSHRSFLTWGECILYNSYSGFFTSFFVTLVLFIISGEWIQCTEKDKNYYSVCLASPSAS